MQSRVVYGNCSNVRRQLFASSLRYPGLQTRYTSNRRAKPRNHDHPPSATRPASPPSGGTVTWMPVSTDDKVIPGVPTRQGAPQLPLSPCPSSEYAHRRSVSGATHGHLSKKGAVSEYLPLTNEDPRPLNQAHTGRDPDISGPPSPELDVFYDIDYDPSMELLSARKSTSYRPSPNRVIALWKTGSLNCLPEEEVEAWSRTESSTGIFLRYLIFLEPPEISSLPRATPEGLENLLKPSAEFFTESITLSLERLGCTEEDIRRWAWIILAPNGEAAAQRYLASSSSSPPLTILNEILRGKYIHIKTLRRLIVDGMNRLSRLSTSGEEERRTLEDNSFTLMVCGLLKHARQTDPPSMTSIARMVARYCDIISNTGDGENQLDRGLYRRLSNICATVICRLSLPAAKTPFESMAYAWEAQQVMLEAGNSFRPGLELDAAGYRAIAIVLLGNKKSWEETESVAHLHRSWPPWKNVLDGMDAQTLPEDEITRVTRVLHNMKAAGYPATTFENAVGILGGRDKDGTPTIPTRSIVKNPERDVVFAVDQSKGDERAEWAARIRATRDVQEAWAAFQAYGGEPSQGMFYEMFRKLVYEEIRVMRGRIHSPTPGDGREVFPVENDNLSETEIQRKRPPNVQSLYAIMKSYGQTLGQRSFHLLIKSADTLAFARQLMLENGMDETVVKQLMHGKKWFGSKNLQLVPESTMTAYLKLLCRFSTYARIHAEKHQKRTHGSEYLLDALHLVKSHKEWNRAGWYTVIRALAGPKFLLRRDRHTGVRSRYYDHGAAAYWWTVLRDALLHLYRAGREIDPDLFQFACYGLYSAIFATRKGHPMAQEDIVAGLDLLRTLFAEVTGVFDADNQPRLLHPMRGTHIHAYVRVLAIAEETVGYVDILDWMVEHQVELDKLAEIKGNGVYSLRRSLVAMRTFAEQAMDPEGEDIARLQALMGRIEQEWGGWPGDGEIEQYFGHHHHYDESFMESEWLYGGKVVEGSVE